MTDIPSIIAVRGYAVPFGRPRHISGRGVEVIDRNTFDKMLAAGARVPIRWDHHNDDAIVLAGKATLFADAYGLAFEATVDMRRHWSLISAMTRRKDPFDQCSIGGFGIASEHPAVVDGMRCIRVTEGHINHITITANAAYGTSTGIWPTHLPIDNAPWRIQEMAARWETGKALSDMQARRRRLIAAAQRIVHGQGHGPGGDLSDDQMSAFNARIAAINVIDRDMAARRRLR